MGKLGNTATTLIRHDYKRATYRALLSEFTSAEVHDFFSRIPMFIDGQKISGPELYKLLWQEKGKIPICWDYGLNNLYESFLIEKGREAEQFHSKILWLNNKSTHVPGKILLTWFYPKLESLFNSVDSRDMVFAFMALFTESWLPKHIHRRVKRWEEKESVYSILIYISDIDFNEFIDFDYEFIAKPQIMNGPLMFGLLPFEKFGMLADTRPPEQIIWEKDVPVHREAGILRIGGEVYGKSLAFSEFCKSQGIDLSQYNPPDLETISIDKDYFCPIRKRIVLHNGCVYGAPVFLNWVSHRKLAAQKKDFIGSFINDIEREDSLQNDALEKRHNELLTFVAGKACFSYNNADESMTLNGQHFIKNVPAKILKYLLNAYLQKGQLEFEYRELKRLFEISLGQKNSNFEVRFYRLIEKLASECPALHIEKTGRGKFSLVIHGAVEFTEE